MTKEADKEDLVFAQKDDQNIDDDAKNNKLQMNHLQMANPKVCELFHIRWMGKL